MPISRQTLALADRLQRLSDCSLTQRQAIRRAIWLQEEARALQEPYGRLPPAADPAARLIEVALTVDHY